MTPAEREVLRAAMDRVLPPGEHAGATEANALGYTDWLFAQERYAGSLARVRTGLALLDSLADGMWGRGFAACTPDERDAVLGRLAEVPLASAQRFFNTLVLLTLNGFLCAPRYGGNRDRAGWRAIGYTPHPNTEGALP